MSRTWGATSWGEIFTGTRPWQLTLDGRKIQLIIGPNSQSLSVEQLDSITISPGFFWTAVHLCLGQLPTVSLDGIPNALARDLLATLRQAKERPRPCLRRTSRALASLRAISGSSSMRLFCKRVLAVGTSTDEAVSFG